MKTIYLLMHKPSTYGDDARVIRAFERREDAEDQVELMATIVRGELAIKEVQLVERRGPDPVQQYLQTPLPMRTVLLDRSAEPNEALP